MKIKAKGFLTAVLFVVMLCLFTVLFMVMPSGATTASAATTHSSVCTIKGRVENTGGSLSTVDVTDNFTVTMQSAVPYGTGTLEQYVKLDWSHIIIKVNVNSFKGHKSFALYKDGEEYQRNTLSGKESMILYQGQLPDGDYKMVYQFSVTKGVTTYPALNYVFYFSVDITAPAYTLTAGGTPISSYSYTNKNISYSASDPNFRYIHYMSPSSSSFYTTSNTTYNVDAKAANTGWWEFYASDTLGNVTGRVKLYLDCKPPELSCSSGASLGGTTGKAFTVSATDGSGTAKLYVKFESEEWFAAGSSSYTVPVTERSGRYYFYSEDGVGNRSDTSWVVLSTEDPSGNFVKSDSDNSVSFVWNNQYWSAKLDGANYTEGRVISTEGQHEIELSNNALKKKTYTFKIDHYYKMVDQTAATCFADGVKEYECSQCGDTYEEVLYSSGHTYSVSSTPSSCTEKEHLTYICNRCGDKYEAEGNYPTGHSYNNEVVTAPTCTTDGLRRSTCEHCGYSFDTKIAANGHNYNITDTTTKNGKTTRTYTCSDCGHSYKQELGDQYEEVTNYVEYLFEKYQPYMWWVLLASAGVWSIVIGVMIAIAHKNEDKEKARKMLINYVIGLVVIAVIVVACPFLVRGIAALVT